MMRLWYVSFRKEQNDNYKSKNSSHRRCEATTLQPTQVPRSLSDGVASSLSQETMSVSQPWEAFANGQTIARNKGLLTDSNS